MATGWQAGRHGTAPSGAVGEAGVLQQRWCQEWRALRHEQELSEQRCGSHSISMLPILACRQQLVQAVQPDDATERSSPGAHLSVGPWRRLLLPIHLQFWRPWLLRGRQATADVDRAGGLNGQRYCICMGAKAKWHSCFNDMRLGYQAASQVCWVGGQRHRWEAGHLLHVPAGDHSRFTRRHCPTVRHLQGGHPGCSAALPPASERREHRRSFPLQCGGRVGGGGP